MKKGQVYPNPASDKLLVQLDLKRTENAELAIFDQPGLQLIRVVSMVIIYLDISSVFEGFYFLSVKTSKGKSVKSFCNKMKSI